MIRDAVRDVIQAFFSGIWLALALVVAIIGFGMLGVHGQDARPVCFGDLIKRIDLLECKVDRLEAQLQRTRESLAREIKRVRELKATLQ